MGLTEHSRSAARALPAVLSLSNSETTRSDTAAAGTLIHSNSFQRSRTRIGD